MGVTRGKVVGVQGMSKLVLTNLKRAVMSRSMYTALISQVVVLSIYVAILNLHLKAETT